MRTNLRLYMYGYKLLIQVFQKSYEVHRDNEIALLSGYYVEVLYATEITNFPYQMNFPQNFNHSHFKSFFIHE